MIIIESPCRLYLKEKYHFSVLENESLELEFPM